MPVKTGTSHAMAAFLLMIVSAIIIKYLEHHKMFAKLMQTLNSYAAEFSAFLAHSFDIFISTNIMVMIFITSFLCFIWGFIYHITRIRH